MEKRIQNLIIEAHYNRDQIKRLGRLTSLKLSLYPDPFPFLSFSRILESQEEYSKEYRRICRLLLRRGLMYGEGGALPEL